MKVPRDVQEIAQVIGLRRALYLVGQLRRCLYKRGSRGTSWHVILYVPKSLTPQHELVRILGWDDAQKLCNAFAGEILHPGTCGDIYRQFKHASIRRLFASGALTLEQLAQQFEMTVRQMRSIVAGVELEEITQEERKAANDEDAGSFNAPRINERNGRSRGNCRVGSDGRSGQERPARSGVCREPGRVLAG